MVLQHNFGEIANRAVKLQKSLPLGFTSAFKEISVQILSWVRQDFEKLSKKDSVNGVSWNGITRGAIRKRHSRLAAYRSMDFKEKVQYNNNAMANHQIGIDTGRLRNSFSIGNKDALMNVSATGCTVGTTYKVADYFEEKGREIIGEHTFDSARLKRIDDIMEKHIKKITDGEI
ncbi:MAG: hypothetical protein K2X29_05495 [Candidatus Obscuribacterales bacterium]|nr:hypothetical protein [Candidatus Obscuribacterales bacterium]